MGDYGYMLALVILFYKFKEVGNANFHVCVTLAFGIWFFNTLFFLHWFYDIGGSAI